MQTLVLVALVLAFATAFGIWDKRRSGRVTVKEDLRHSVSASEIGSELGEEATVLQFSSAFCTPCRAT